MSWSSSRMPRRQRQRSAAGSMPVKRAPVWGSGAAALHHELLDLGDRLGGIESLRAGARAVHDGVAAVELERILEVVQARTGVLVARVGDPAVGLQQDRRPQVALAVPP